MQSIIIDLDGTLCDSQVFNGDWQTWLNSTLFALHNEWCSELVHSFANRGYKILYVTARYGTPRGREITEQWLDIHGFGFLNCELLMRDANDDRPAPTVKEEIYYTKISPFYNVLLAIDDNPDVCHMWNRLGIPTLHVVDKNFTQ